MGKVLPVVVTLALVAGAAALLFVLLEPSDAAPRPQPSAVISRPAGPVGPAGTTARMPAAPSAAQPAPFAAKRIAPEEVKRWLDSGRDFAFIDVREPDEFEKWRIPGAILVPIEPRNTFGQRLRRVAPNQNRDVVLFCRSGRRSDTAALMLNDLGYRRAYNMGGIIDWEYTTEGADE
ncbi:MAG: rhodanese-like domain-containing protein [Planctomycetaceae bacterium]|nr:rhodanese-like domain-containing protein [Planctomycetaceae bacterium]